MKIIVKDIEILELDGKFERYCIDILTDEEIIEVFLYHKQCGIKSLMFGLTNNLQNRLDLSDIIASNLEEHIAMYTEEFMAE